MGKLTATRLRTLKVPGMYGDGVGLYLKIGRGDARSWIQRIKYGGRRRDIGLGRFPDGARPSARGGSAQPRANRIRRRSARREAPDQRADLLRGGRTGLRGEPPALAYKRAAFEPVWKRYDIPSSEAPPKPSATTPQPNVSTGFDDSISATSPDRVADGKSLNSAVGNGCGVVAATNPPSTGNGTSDDVEKRAEVMENGGGLSSEEVKPLVMPDTDDLPTNL